MTDEAKTVIAPQASPSSVAGPVVFTAQEATPKADASPAIVPPFEVTPIVFSQVAPTVLVGASAAVAKATALPAAPIVEKK